MRSTINQSTIVAALKLTDGIITSKHKRCLEDLAGQLLQVPGHTLGMHAPETNRILPSLDAMERAGIIATKRHGRDRISEIKLLAGERASDTEGPHWTVSVVLEALASLGGFIDDQQQGYAGTQLRDYVNDGASKSSWRLRVETAEREGFITRSRDKTGTRTYRIELTDLGRAATGMLQVEEPEPEVQQDIIMSAIELPGEEIDVSIIDEPLVDEVTIDEGLAGILDEGELDDAAFVEQVAFKFFEICAERAFAPQIDPEVHSATRSDLHVARSQVKSLQTIVDGLKRDVERLAQDKDELEKLLKVGDEELARMQTSSEHIQRTLDKMAEDRDNWKRKFGSLEREVQVYLSASGRAGTGELATRLRKLMES